MRPETTPPGNPLPAREESAPPRFQSLFSLNRFHLLLIIAVAFGLRVIELDALPLSLSLDEATNGLDALQLLRLSWLTPFLQNNFGRETAFFYLQGLALRGYGISFFSLRFVSVLAGTITVPLLYAVGQRLHLEELLGWRVKTGSPQTVASRGKRRSIIGLLAATGLAVSYWHLFFSRLGLRAILLPPVLLALVWCFWRGWFDGETAGQLRSGRPGPSARRLGWLVLAGSLLGLTFYIYLAARLLPFLFLLFVIIELITSSARRKEKLVAFLLFILAAGLVATPLLLYFGQNPQALASRTQAISILATAAPLETLTGNVIALWHLHLWPGRWLGQWPALNLVSAAGFLLGLGVCLFRLKKAAARFLLLWWGIGLAPVLLSIQDWAGQTTLLRGVVAWPALFLIVSTGLVALGEMLSRRLRKGSRSATAAPAVILFWILLLGGGLLASYRYFGIWATTYNQFSDHPPYLARYLNRQTDHPTLTPVKFYAETVTNFLLQAGYQPLTNIESEPLSALLQSNPAAVYLLPDEAVSDTTFVLLEPAADGRGKAYLLAPLSLPQAADLARYTQDTAPLGSVRDGEQEPIAHLYPLPADRSFFSAQSLSSVANQAGSPGQAVFDQTVRLAGYHLEPAVLKPGQTVALTLYWQALHPIDGDYNLFIHLFDISHRQRQGQINTPLSGILFEAHRWPPYLVVPGVHYLTLPEDAPEGAYRFELGLYHASNQHRLPVTSGPTQSLQTATDHLILGKVQVRQRPPAPPDYPLNHQFGGKIALQGVDLEPSGRLAPGETLHFRLYWQASAPLEQNYTVFTHLVDADGNLKAQRDNAPQQGRYPTSWWDPGETIIDAYALPLPPDLEAGRYTLRVGLYQPETGRRLPLKNQDQDFVDLPGSITIQN